MAGSAGCSLASDRKGSEAKAAGWWRLGQTTSKLVDVEVTVVN